MDGEMGNGHNSQVGLLGALSCSVTDLMWEADEAPVPTCPGDIALAWIYLNQQVNWSCQWFLQQREDRVKGGERGRQRKKRPRAVRVTQRLGYRGHY